MTSSSQVVSRLLSPINPFTMLYLGGTAGCLLAGRLATASPTLTILVLEAGPPTRELLAHIQPARAPSHISPTSTTMQFHKAEKTEALGGRELVVSCAQCLGGGSSVNCTLVPMFPASTAEVETVIHVSHDVHARK